MTTYGLTSTGFVPKTLEECVAERQASYRGNFGENIDLDERGPYGQQIAIDSEREANLWALAQAIWDAFDPDNAEDDQLDALCKITGTFREGPLYSTMTVRCVGTVGTVLLPGRVVSVVGSGVRFASVAEATIAEEGATDYVDVLFQAEETGPLVCLAGTVTIETPVSGWDSAAAVEDADVGRDNETNADLRIRRIVEMRTGANAALEAIRTAVSQVEGVNSVVVFENTTDVTDGDGIPPHSVEVLVDLEGGTDEETVRAAIFASVGAGIEAHGDNSGTVEDSTGIEHTVAFTEAEQVEIYESCALTVNADEYPVDGDDQVQLALLTYGNTYTTGQDVKASRQIMALRDIPGIIDAVVLVSDHVTPDDTSVTISMRQRAVFDSGRISVESTPGTP
jgi:uncharacterized phage protein gp47/JayE